MIAYMGASADSILHSGESRQRSNQPAAPPAGPSGPGSTADAISHSGRGGGVPQPVNRFFSAVTPRGAAQPMLGRGGVAPTVFSNPYAFSYSRGGAGAAAPSVLFGRAQGRTEAHAGAPRGESPSATQAGGKQAGCACGCATCPPGMGAIGDGTTPTWAWVMGASLVAGALGYLACKKRVL